jgi:proline dehydrogenase
MSLLRRILVSASESNWLREHAPRLVFVRRASQRFLPGETVDDAIAAARRLAGDGIMSLLTHLGENVRDRSEAALVTQQYVELIDRIREESLEAEISVKLTQLGLDLDLEFCYANLIRLIEHSAGKMLWIDMEQSQYAEATLNLYTRARKAHVNTGVAVQAYLRRTTKDVEALIQLGAGVRLVKGAYNEPPEVAFEGKSEVDANFFALAQRLLSAEARKAGVRGVIATHDLKMIVKITDWSARERIAKREVEFAMLYGIQRAEQVRLAREGYRSDVLVSYGTYWFPWYMRRLAERPANIFFILRNFFSK